MKNTMRKVIPFGRLVLEREVGERSWASGECGFSEEEDRFARSFSDFSSLPPEGSYVLGEKGKYSSRRLEYEGTD